MYRTSLRSSFARETVRIDLPKNVQYAPQECAICSSSSPALRGLVDSGKFLKDSGIRSTLRQSCSFPMWRHSTWRAFCRSIAAQLTDAEIVPAIESNRLRGCALPHDFTASLGGDWWTLLLLQPITCNIAVGPKSSLANLNFTRVYGCSTDD